MNLPVWLAIPSAVFCVYLLVGLVLMVITGFTKNYDYAGWCFPMIPAFFGTQLVAWILAFIPLGEAPFNTRFTWGVGLGICSLLFGYFAIIRSLKSGK